MEVLICEVGQFSLKFCELLIKLVKLHLVRTPVVIKLCLKYPDLFFKLLILSENCATCVFTLILGLKKVLHF